MPTIAEIAQELQPVSVLRSTFLGRVVFTGKLLVIDGDQAVDPEDRRLVEKIVPEMRPLVSALLDNRIAKKAIRELATELMFVEEMFKPEEERIGAIFRIWIEVNRSISQGKQAADAIS